MNLLILGHFGGHNTGDEAMLYGLLTQLNVNSDFRIELVSKGSSSDYFFNFPVKIVKPGVKQILSSLKNSDFVILCGGTHFHDDYVFSRYLRHVRYLFRYLGIFTLARISGKKVCLIGNGLGPFKYSFTKVLTQAAIRLSNLTTVRDMASYEEIKTLGMVSSNTFLTFDLAALLPLSRSEIDSSLIGVSLTPLHYYNAEGEDLNQLYQDQVFDGLNKAMVANANLKVKIFVIRGGERESDVDISRLLFNRLIGIFSESRVALSNFNYNPISTLNEIAECRGGFIASRYHSAMLGYISSLPLLFLAYHRKLEDLAFDVKLHPDACVPLNKSYLGTDKIKNSIYELSIGNDQRFIAEVTPNVMVEKSLENIHFLKDLMRLKN
ncbi:polysaccharide pyruvyl transferase family protein [Algoriphagus halophilus]|uniref:Polysaccharide pyruvyl transferase family protein WcaK n=1 Tax=Algoriphagus halophilus TaxID=226505 RepID=A0A1N6E964_9BACT|nr:polysaccharide pyruvyl transferase family protein [Algoriphagus halophilus]SIN79595.1 Polysaccharide pyruvyl transferase family protein WcaK [Algoriphagus halophilus]